MGAELTAGEDLDVATATTVIGLGNTLLGDDGVGVRVVGALRDLGARGLTLVDGGTMGFRLADLVARAGACILVDAADLGAPPGHVAALTPDDLQARFADGHRSSAHEAGLIDLLGLVRLEDRLPRRLMVVAIQPGPIDWGEDLSAAVSAALPRAAQEVMRIAGGWADG
ncbi:hydrogenase maturation protease [Acidimangrovimonas sediminis]|uniref:hydrogenase maturation protease n=1 Tax=Acidimangrovimonas sediminis TaxID=2056283 RepID=UPI001304F70C|nr:hydrogenase maturation protease [Acidimangrovimonas sediminis]